MENVVLLLSNPSHLALLPLDITSLPLMGLVCLRPLVCYNLVAVSSL